MHLNREVKGLKGFLSRERSFITLQHSFKNEDFYFSEWVLVSSEKRGSHRIHFDSFKAALIR